MTKNVLPKKWGNFNSLKNNRNIWKTLQLMCTYLTRICWERSTVLQAIILIVLWFMWSVKKHSALEISEVTLTENSHGEVWFQ